MNDVPHQNYQHQQNYSYEQNYPQPNQGFMPQHREIQQQPPRYAYNRPPPILQQNQQNPDM